MHIWSGRGRRAGQEARPSAGTHESELSMRAPPPGLPEEEARRGRRRSSRCLHRRLLSGATSSSLGAAGSGAPPCLRRRVGFRVEGWGLRVLVSGASLPAPTTARTDGCRSRRRGAMASFISWCRSVRPLSPPCAESLSEVRVCPRMPMWTSERRRETSAPHLQSWPTYI